MDLDGLQVSMVELGIVEMGIIKYGGIWTAKAVIASAAGKKIFLAEDQQTIRGALEDLVRQVTEWRQKTAS
jgi:hypothetical protein